MKRTNVIELKPSKKQKKILDAIRLRSACVYNLANYQIRQVYIQNKKNNEKKKLPSAFTLQSDLKSHQDFKNLGAGYSQQIIAKLWDNWTCFFKSIKSKNVNHKVSIPKYSKNRKTNTTIPFLFRSRCDLYNIDKEYIYVSIPQDLKKKHDIKGRLRIKFKGILRWKGKQGSCEIDYDFVKKSYYARPVISKVNKKALYNKNTKKWIYKKIVKVKNSTKIASIDLGIKRLITTLINKKCIAYDTQEAFLKYENTSKEIYRLQTILSLEWKNKKTNKPLKFISKRISKLFRKQRLQLDHLHNQIIKKLFDRYIKNKVNKIIIGNISNIRLTYNLNKYQKRLNKMINNFWSFSKLKNKIECKAEEHGIEVIPVFEGYTSTTCPENKKHKVDVNDRDFLCLDCGYKHDRDAVGCINIMKNYTHEWVETKPNLSIVEIQ